MATPTKTQAEQKQEQIAARAYQLWEQGGHQHGRDVEYWLQAEAELAAAQRPARVERSASAPRPSLATARQATAPAATPRPSEPLPVTPQRATRTRNHRARI